MKKTLLISLLMFNTFAGNWKFISKTSIHANNFDEIVELEIAYPEIFLELGYKAELIKAMAVFDSIYMYEGETICSDDDPRLIFNEIGFGLCLWPYGDYSSACMSGLTSMPSSEDPCSL